MVRELLILLKVRPRGVFFGTVPVLCQRCFAEQRRLAILLCGLVFEYGHQHPPSRGQLHVFEKANYPFIVYYSLNGSQHLSPPRIFYMTQ